jgi:plasmid stability protein
MPTGEAYRRCGATHGRSMEDEAREILRTALFASQSPREDLATAIAARLQPLGGVDLPETPRDPLREPPGFE